MPLRLAPLDERHPDLVALMGGPRRTLRHPTRTAEDHKQALLSARRASASSTDWLVATDTEPLVMQPFPAITTERYRLYQQT